ncbi:repetitive organellar protein isoform X4 [Hydra vulgaris]|uniref:Repetitive organellar protein isoform X4 n=1 Tax=Hydra vulgaris TaxID=6087 RepID=A0ABM4CCR9_HYDVU
MSRKGRIDRNDIDSVLDDLLDSDVEDKKLQDKNSKLPQKKVTEKPKVSLTSKTSDADFYKNLKNFASNEDISNHDDEPLSEEGVQKLANDIGNLDDLDDNLFANLKSNEKKNQKKKVNNTDAAKNEKNLKTYDLNNPLADLVSDDESLKLFTNKKKEKSEANQAQQSDSILSPSHSQKISSTNETKAKSTNETITKPIGSRRNSQITFPINDNDMPSEKIDTSENKDTKENKSLYEKKQLDSAVGNSTKNLGRPTTKKIINDDIFGDDELPEMSDKEVLSKPVKKQSSSEDVIPSEKATKALDNLLNAGKVSTQKKNAPMTMLEQIMSGTRKKENAESEEILFGNYSPSIGNQGERNTTSANARSVRFASDLGLDDEQLFSSSPKSLSNKKKPSNLKSSSIDLNSSLDSSINNGLTRSNKAREQNIVNKKEDTQKTTKSSDNWLELGDDLTDQFIDSSDFLPSAKENRLQRKNSSKSLDNRLELGDELTNQLGGFDDFSTRTKKEKPLNKQTSNETKNNDFDSSYFDSSNQKSEDFGLSNQKLEGFEDSGSKNVSLKNKINKNEKQEVFLEEKDDFLSLLKKKKIEKSATKQSIATQDITENLSLPDISEKAKPEAQFEPSKDKVQYEKNISNQSNTIEPQIQNLSMQQLSLHQNQPTQQQLLELEKQQQYFQYLNQQNSLALLQQQQFQHQQQVAQQLQFLNTPFNLTSNVSHEALKNENAKKLAAEQSFYEVVQTMKNTSAMQSELSKPSSDTDFKNLQDKYFKLEEIKSQSNMDFTAKIYELESKIKSLELECSFLSSSQSSLKQRHQDELNALESSHKMRLEYVEESYKRRVKQLEDENKLLKTNYDEKINLLVNEHQDQITTLKQKLDFKDQNHFSDIERLNEVHKKVITNLTQEHDERIRQLHVIKKQEVEATVNAFSQAKSFQGLVEEVKSSTKEVSNLQERFSTDYQALLREQEITLQMRNEQLEIVSNRLQQREKINEEERIRLQTLVSRLEIQLRDQTRLYEQDKWKLNQDENRLKTLQHVFEEDRRITSQQLQEERTQIAKAKEEMLAEQRKLIVECYEEKRLLNEEKLALLALQREVVDANKNDRRSIIQAETDFELMAARQKHDSSTFNIRLAHVQQEEARLALEKSEFLKHEQSISSEQERLREIGRVLHEKSKEVEDFAKEAKQMYDESVKSSEQTSAFRSYLENLKNELEVRAISLEQKEAELFQHQENLEELRRKAAEASQRMTCLQCKGFLAPCNTSITGVPSRSQSYFGKRGNDSIEVTASKAILTSTPDLGADMNRNFNNYKSQTCNLNEHVKAPNKFMYLDNVEGFSVFQQNGNSIGTSKSFQGVPIAKIKPPDLLLNDLEFRSHLRRWDSAKGRDDDFIEEETKFLETLSQNR